jgi:hypothetical protein
MNYSRTELFDLFLELENKHALLERKTVGGVFFWKLIRFSLYESIAKTLGLMGRAKKFRNSSVDRSAGSHRAIKQLCALFGKVDAIVLEHPRKILTDGEYVDPITSPIVKALAASHKKYLLAQDTRHDILTPAGWHRLQYGDSRLERMIARITRLTAAPADAATKEIVKTVLGELSLRLGVEISYGNIEERLLRFLAERKFWTWVFRITRCKILYLVCSYGKEGIIAAAHDRNIEVVELQHGVIYKYHAGYSFSRGVVPYFPDRFIAFGRKWCGSFFPLGSQDVSVQGYDYLNEQVKEYPHRKKPRSVVFLSQWAINDHLYAYAVELSRRRPELNIVYKFHPREKDSVVESAREDCPGITFIKNEKPLYAILDEAECAVGVFSTAVVEALAFGCRLVLIEAPGIEAFEDVIADLKIPVVSSSDDFIASVSAKADYSQYMGKLDGWLFGLSDALKASSGLASSSLPIYTDAKTGASN